MRIHEHEHQTDDREEQHAENRREPASTGVIVNRVGILWMRHQRGRCITCAAPSQQLDGDHDGDYGQPDMHQHQRAPYGQRILRGGGARRDERAPWAMSRVGAADVLLAHETPKAARIRTS